MAYAALSDGRHLRVPECLQAASCGPDFRATPLRQCQPRLVGRPLSACLAYCKMVLPQAMAPATADAILREVPVGEKYIE